jgi:phospholipid/cholesterol/gamma-HCH transport system permease protein
MNEGWIEAEGDGDALVLRAGGAWCIADAAALDRKLGQLALPPSRRARIDLAAIEALDTAGAWLVLRLQRALNARGTETRIENLAHDLEPLLRQVEKRHEPAPAPPPPPRAILADSVGALGQVTLDELGNVAGHLGFLGLVVVTAARTLFHPGRVRMVSLVAQMARVGVTALPIVGLLSFLIGVVMAYQGADQLRPFGAEILTVNLVGLGFLRELGVMLAAIIVAGRSGSAFTAEIGAMQVNEEIDALRTLALDPIELLVLPRLAALVLTLPLVTFYANVMGLFGGAVLCWVVLGLPLPIFTQQLHDVLTLGSFWLGMIKAPFFAAAIALVGCYEGLNVERSAESVGRHTTRAVVQSIFLVIVIDAAFAILFATLHI